MKISFTSMIYLGLIYLFSGLVLANQLPSYISECMDCHGVDGISQHSQMPSIAGASTTYIEGTMFAYLDGLRPAVESKYFFGDTSRASTDMKKIAEQLTEAQIAEIAKYFAKKPFVAAKQEFNAELAAKGKTLHDSKCEKCHQQAGALAEDDAGILAGQDKKYLDLTMKHILDGSRDAGRTMRQKLAQLKEDEWQALLEFYASKQ